MDDVADRRRARCESVWPVQRRSVQQKRNVDHKALRAIRQAVSTRGYVMEIKVSSKETTISVVRGRAKSTDSIHERIV